MEATDLFPDKALVRVLHRLFRHDELFEMNKAALAEGRKEARRIPILADYQLRVLA
jgi:hypothetical protein